MPAACAFVGRVATEQVSAASAGEKPARRRASAEEGEASAEESERGGEASAEESE
jgi:hypothetical protein